LFFLFGIRPAPFLQPTLFDLTVFAHLHRSRPYYPRDKAMQECGEFSI